MNWVGAGQIEDEHGYKNHRLVRNGMEAVISFKDGNVWLIKPRVGLPFKDFVEIERWLAVGEAEEDETVSREILYLRAVESMVAQLGYRDQLLSAQGADPAFYEASIKMQKAGFANNHKEIFIASLTVGALKKYLNNKTAAIYFLEALEESLLNDPSSDDGTDAEKDEASSYHPVLDVIVQRIEPLIRDVARTVYEKEIAIATEVIGYAASYFAIKDSGKIPQAEWNNFSSSVEHRITGRLSEDPHNSASNALPDGGIEYISYSTGYRSYLTLMDRIIDSLPAPTIPDVIPVLKGLGIDISTVDVTKMEELSEAFVWSVELCARDVVPRVKAIFR